MSTIARSLLLVMPLVAVIALILAALFLPHVAAILHSIPGQPYSVSLLLLPFAWAAQRNAVLVPQGYITASTNAL